MASTHNVQGSLRSGKHPDTDNLRTETQFQSRREDDLIAGGRSWNNDLRADQEASTSARILEDRNDGSDNYEKYR